MPSFKIIGLLVLEKNIFKGFYHIWAWRPSWSYDQDHLYKLSFPLPKEAPHKIWLWLAKRFQRRRCFTLLTTTTTDAGVRVYYKLILWAWRLRWAKKWEKNNQRIISKTHAHLHSLKKTSEKFQNNRWKTVRGVAPTRYLVYTRLNKEMHTVQFAN